MMFVIGGAMTLIVILSAILAPVISPQNYIKQDLEKKLRPPFWMKGGSLENPLGTDHLGRDLMSRILYGARVSLYVGIGAVLIAASVGVFLGVISGYFGGWIDSLIVGFADIQLSFPPLFLAIALMAVIPQTLTTLVIVLGGISWVQFGRVGRGSTLSVREKEFVEAAASLGTSNSKIILRHIIPNIISPLIAIATVYVSTVIMSEAALSFLGLGVQPPTPSWGGMLSEGRTYFKIAWWYATFPGLSILLTALGVNLLGDGLQSER